MSVMWEDECVVCCDAVPRTIGPCMHTVMCETCLARWFQTSPTCSLCRQDSYGLVEPPSAKTYMTIPLPEGTYAGITVANSTAGVRINSLHPNDRCAAYGLRRGDVVTQINGLPCTNHIFAVRMINAADRANADIYLTTVRRAAPRRWPRWLRPPDGRSRLGRMVHHA